MNKYGSRKTVVDGITFDSKREAQYYCDLLLLKRAGEVKSFTLQPEFELMPAFTKNGKKIRAIKYRADFLVMYADGREEIQDSKGMRTEIYKIKRKLFEFKYPNLTIVEV